MTVGEFHLGANDGALFVHVPGFDVLGGRDSRLPDGDDFVQLAVPVHGLDEFVRVLYPDPGVDTQSESRLEEVVALYRRPTVDSVVPEKPYVLGTNRFVGSPVIAGRDHDHPLASRERVAFPVVPGEGVCVIVPVEPG